MNALDDSKSKTILLDCHVRWSVLLSSAEKRRTVDVLDHLAAHYVRENNFLEAESLLNESYDLRSKHLENAHHDTLSTMYELAKVNLRLQTDNIVGDNLNKAIACISFVFVCLFNNCCFFISYWLSTRFEVLACHN